ncbi:MAG: glycosyltransferase family 2 protein [Pseudomonadota bacterium]
MTTARMAEGQSLAEPLVSVIVPMYNEEQGIDLFFERVEAAVSKVTEYYEIVCVDDGSSDSTFAKLVQHRVRNERIKVIALSRNFGKDIALTAGMDHADGQTIVPIDADLQDPPELIGEMLEKWREGFDVVYACRASRDTDTAAKRLTSRAFYSVHNWLADVRIPHDTGDFRLMDRQVAHAIKQLPERNRFMKGLFSWVGFKQTGIAYARESRAAGTSKWAYWKLWNFAIDGITASSTVPLRIWTYLGVIIASASFAYAGYLILRTLMYGVSVPGYASLMVTILFLGGINILATGIIGEYLGRVFIEVRNRPLYLIREAHGLPHNRRKEDKWKEKSTNAWTGSNPSTGGSRRAAAS